MCELFQEGALYPKLRPDFISLPRAWSATRAAVATVECDTPISCDAPTRTPRAPDPARARAGSGARGAVSYTHLTLPTKRIV